jgi:hypothetical protein
MRSATVTVRTLDGGSQEWSEDAEPLLRRHKALQARGYAGKELIHALWTDDWAAPPRLVEISGEGFDTIRIPYE